MITAIKGLTLLVFLNCLIQDTYAQDYGYMTPRELQMIEQINELRADPGSYITYVEEYLEVGWKPPGEQEAALELIDTLKKLGPLQQLNPSRSMYQDAKAHGKWMRRTNKFEHSTYNCYENLAAGNTYTRNVIIDLLIDNGVPSRGHRWNLLEPSLKYVACYEVKPIFGHLGQWSVVQQFN